MESHNLSSPLPRCLPASSSPRVAAVLAPMLGAEFVLGLLGNGLALFVFCARTRPWTATVVLLASLVAADFLLVASLPLRVDYYLHGEAWRFGTAACRANLFLVAANRSASAAFLAAIALLRYLKVVWPHRALSRASGRAAARVAGGIWAAILLLHGHLLLATPPAGSCISYQLADSPGAWLRWHQALYFLEFFVTLALILFAIASIWRTLGRRRRGLGGRAGPRRALRVLAAVVAVYTACFLPSVLFGAASHVAFRLRACRALDVCSQLFHGSLAFTYLNSVLDPALYCFSSPSFFRQCRALLGLGRGSQGPGSDESSSQPPARAQEASRR
ncbi:oxoeicosanoid receptor 1 [Pipistrellus kuhlii]|nr:oxoeicosanoid receptor 1 [Pipistrellus kuhlii]